MIIVIDLMRNIFILMFIVLLILEIIAMICLTTLYKGPLKSNQYNVESTSLTNTKEALASFNNILIQKLYSIETDLLMIAKHVYPMYLTQNNLNAIYPKYNSLGNFYLSYKGCLINIKTFEFHKLVLNYNMSSNYNLIDSILKKYENFSKFKENEIIQKMFEDERMNYITYYSNISSYNLREDQKIESYVCYTVSMLKSLLIRNLIFEKNKIITNRFNLFINNKYIFQYPINFINEKNLPSINYYNPSCISFSGNNCIYSLTNFTKNFNTDEEIYFDKPFIRNGHINGRGCIKIKFSDLNNNLDENYACLDFDINNILNKILTGKKHSPVNLFLISQLPNVKDDFSLHYTNVFDVTQFNKSVFQHKEADERFKVNNSDISLFHGLYYEIFNSINRTFPNTNLALGNQYKELALALSEIIYMYKDKEKECDSYENNFSNKTTIHSFFKEKIDVTGLLKNKTVNDTFQFVLFPIKLNYTSYNKTNFIFQNGCSSRILFYALAKTRVGNETIPDDVYYILILKCVRNFFFYMAVLLFATIVYYIICEIYVKYLLSPVKKIRYHLEKLIKERNSEESEYDKDHKNSKSRNKKDEPLKLFRNEETKKLEKKLMFLKKIVMMKQAQGDTDYNVKSSIYLKFLSFLKKSNSGKENYRKCLLIIAYAYYKDKNFSNAIAHLEKLKSSIEEEESELLGKNESLEQKIMNVQSLIQNKQSDSKVFIPYFNECSEIEFNQPSDVETLIELRIFKQRVLYLYGLIKFLEFQNKKEVMKIQLISRNDRREALKQERYLLESSITQLKKAYDINNMMNFNQIKSIFILILISKCYYNCDEYLEASNNLKDALLKFCDLNKSFFDKSLNESIDPRVMHIINGIVIEQILFLLGRVSNKSGKRQLAAWIYNKMIEINYFVSNDIYKKITNKLYKYLFSGDDNNYTLKKEFLNRVCRRLDSIPSNKKVCIMMSENLLKNFGSNYELKEILLNCMERNLNQNDLLSYFQFDSEIRYNCKAETKNNMVKNLWQSSKFCKFSANENSDKPNFFKALENSMNLLNDNDQFYMERDQITLNKYIFAFVYSSDLIFNKKEEVTKIVEDLKSNKVSFYTFCFDDCQKEKRIKNFKNDILKELIEGYIIFVKNFEIIKQAFQNISGKGSQKNILKSKFDSHKHII